jgi:hypothetical protein
MSVNPDGMASGVANEFVDLEHQVIRQKLRLDGDADAEVLPGNPAAEFDPGERKLDREEIAQLVYYRRFASINFLEGGKAEGGQVELFGIVDASVGINGDLFRPVTTQETFGLPDGELLVDKGGEIGLLDNYQVYALPFQSGVGSGGLIAAGTAQISEHHINFYDWPTGGPIVDSFDTITCGFGAGTVTNDEESELQVELRYDFWWDVAEQGRSTNPFGRPSTR